MPRYKYSQESGADFKVVDPDKADGQEDTNQVRQVLDDLGNLLGHSKRNDLYPKDGTTGGKLAIPESQLNISNIVFCSDYDHPDDAITAIGSANKTLLVTEVETCDTNFTVPANVTVKFERGGKWTINTGVTVTINGQVEAGLFEIFIYVGTGVCALSKNSELYPEWWGALADGTTDDYTALSRTVTVAAGLRWINLRATRTYLINTELSLHTGSEGVKLNGNFATIKAGGAMTNVISIGDTTTIKVQLRNLIINADDVATYGIYLMMVTETNSLIQNCSVTKAVSHGWYLRKCQVARFENVRAHINGGAGFFIDDCNASTFDSIRSTSNTGNGITVQKTDFTGGCQMFNIDAEANIEHGVEIVNTLSPVTINGGWLGGNTKDGILIGGSARGVSVHSVGINGGDVGNVYRAVRLNDGAAGCDIVDNKFAYSAGTQFGNVVDESSSFNRIYPNYHRNDGAILGNTTPVVGEMITHNTVSMGGYLAGGESISIGASGSKTFTFTPSGTFNIPGAGDRGAYLVEIDFVGYFVGIDETCFKRFQVYLATNAAAGYDGSTTEIISIGDSRKTELTGATPAAAGSSTFAVVFSNADDSSFDGYFTWRVIMTTKGKLTLEVT